MTAKNLILIFVCLMVLLGNFVLAPARAENSTLKGRGGAGAEHKIRALKEASEKLSELPEVSVYLMDADLAGPLTVSSWMSRAAGHGVQITRAVGQGSSGEGKNIELSGMLDKDALTGRLRQKMLVSGSYTSLAGFAEFLVDDFSAESGIVIDEMSITGYAFELTVSIFVREKA